MKNNLILIGFMGSGKTTVGSRLSACLQAPFMDTDAWIEENQRRTVPEIFAAEGEAFFRQLETTCLESLLKGKEEGIIATGGGILVKEENRPLLRQLGRIIYLRVSPEEAEKRLSGDQTRPLLLSGKPSEKIRELLAVREEMYLQAADLVVDTAKKQPEEIAAEILHKWKETNQ